MWRQMSIYVYTVTLLLPVTYTIMFICNNSLIESYMCFRVAENLCCVHTLDYPVWKQVTKWLVCPCTGTSGVRVPMLLNVAALCTHNSSWCLAAIPCCLMNA